LFARIKNLLSNPQAGGAAASDLSQSFDDDVRNSNDHIEYPEMAATWKRTEAHKAVRSIYETAGLPMPLIISTQSPLESYFAKAAIDVFSDAGQPHAWHYRFRDKAAKGCWEIRKNAAQSILDSGWRAGQAGTGYHAWGDLSVYSGDDKVLWTDIPPNTRFR